MRKVKIKSLPKAQGGSEIPPIGGPPEYETVYVTDPNDPAYQEYLYLQNLYNWSNIQDFDRRYQLNTSSYYGIKDPDTTGVFQPSRYSEDYDQWNKPIFNDDTYDGLFNNNMPGLSNYNSDETGYYGSKANRYTFNTQAELDNFIAANRALNPSLARNSYDRTEGIQQLIDKYAPIGYDAMVDWASPEIHNYYTHDGSNARPIYKRPTTPVIEDNVNREALKAIYPGYSDEEIDKVIADRRLNPSYVTNSKTRDGDNQYINFADSGIEENKDPNYVHPNAVKQQKYNVYDANWNTIPGKKTNTPYSSWSPIPGTTGYLPDRIGGPHDVQRQRATYLPRFGPPESYLGKKYVYNEPPKVQESNENYTLHYSGNPGVAYLHYKKRNEDGTFTDKNLGATQVKDWLDDEQQKQFHSPTGGTANVNYNPDIKIYSDVKDANSEVEKFRKQQKNIEKRRAKEANTPAMSFKYGGPLSKAQTEGEFSPNYDVTKSFAENMELNRRAQEAGWNSVDEYRNAGWAYKGYAKVPDVIRQQRIAKGIPADQIPEYEKIEEKKISPELASIIDLQEGRSRFDKEKAEEEKRKKDRENYRMPSYPNDPAGLPSVPIWESLLMAPVALGSAGLSGLGEFIYGAGASSPLVQATVAGGRGLLNAAPSSLPWLNLGNALTYGFGVHGANQIRTGEVAKPWIHANATGNPMDYANAVGENLLTALELAPFVGPLVKTGVEAAIPAVNAATNFASKYTTPVLNAGNKFITRTGEVKNIIIPPRLSMNDASLYNKDKSEKLLRYIFDKNYVDASKEWDVMTWNKRANMQMAEIKGRYNADAIRKRMMDALVANDTQGYNQALAELNKIGPSMNAELDAVRVNLSQKLANKLDYPVNLENLGSMRGGFGTVVPTTHDPMKLVKFGTLLEEEATAPKIFEKLDMFGRASTDRHVGLPLQSHVFADMPLQISRNPGPGSFLQVLPKVPGKSLVDFVNAAPGNLDVLRAGITEESIANTVRRLNNLQQNNLGIDWQNPNNFLFDPATGEFGIVDIGAMSRAVTGPEGAGMRWFNTTGLNYGDIFEKAIGAVKGDPSKASMKIRTVPSQITPMMDRMPQYSFLNEMKKYPRVWGKNYHGTQDWQSIFQQQEKKPGLATMLKQFRGTSSPPFRDGGMTSSKPKKKGAGFQILTDTNGKYVFVKT